tara:strand:+ start:394 stop:588 length:195 start_codon:yes stop_codon:yes gene_type:complete
LEQYRIVPKKLKKLIGVFYRLTIGELSKRRNSQCLANDLLIKKEKGRKRMLDLYFLKWDGENSL